MEKDKKPQPQIKKYVIRKYVYATNITKAIQIEKNQEVDEIFIDDSTTQSAQAEIIGFKYDS